MALNLLLSQTPANIKNIFEHSFAAWQRHRTGRGTVPAATLLWEDFLRHLSFLQAEGFVGDDDTLTGDGRWAARLRLDHPLLVAQCLRENVFPQDDEKLLAAAMAVFAYDREDELHVAAKDLPQNLNKLLGRLLVAIRPLQRRLENAGFPHVRLHRAAGAAVYHWANGRDWELVIKTSGIAEGDMATLVFRTADNLRQLASLKDTHPQVAGSALRAAEAILREPVLFL
jgi:superfamily II RNA helicase